MPVYRCPKDGCTYATDDVAPEQALVFLQIHGYGHQIQPAPLQATVPQATAAEKIRRPALECGITLER